jgi:choline dehydrogenase-like flavoprotein
MAYDVDVLVIGSGAGGGTFAHACARTGKSVLLLERGRKFSPETDPPTEQSMLIDKKPYEDREVAVNGTPRRLFVGGILGGGTALYGATLLRPSRDDFHPGKHYGDRLPRALWDWPVGYDALEPFYTEAERLYHVAGWDGDDFGPLPRPRGGYPGRPLPIKPINTKLISANRARGLRPFCLPLAIDAERCLQCSSCPGYVCTNGSRRSSAHLVEQTAAEDFPLRVQTGVEAERFVLRGDGLVDGLQVHDRATGSRTVYRARRYVLAAGAIGSPLLLLRSGVGGPLVGRHYMPHLSPVVLGIFPRRTGADATFVKQVGFADYYFGTRRFPHKMGLIQSLPVPGPLMLAKATRGRLPQRLLQLLRRHMLPLTGSVEDLPDPANRVTWGPDGRPSLRHKFSTYDLERGQRLGREMAHILKRAGAVYCIVRRFPSDEHVAHQCGTLRFGTSPAHAVVGPDCRLFDQPDVFVVDSSFLPTSLGVGPALTIMANALRVAGLVAREL